MDAAIALAIGNANTPVPTPSPPKKRRFTVTNPDPAILEWIPGTNGTTNAVAGGTACGFVNAPLFYSKIGYVEDPPRIKVYVCMRFSKKQDPDTADTLFVHCGGPGSVTECSMGTDDDGMGGGWEGNILTIDQRGLGRSLPSFFNEDCRFPDIEPKDEWDFGRGFPPGISSLNPTPAEELSMRRFLRGAKDRILSCYSHTEFIMKAKGSNNSWNFLEFSGTQDLAYDLNLVRQAIGADKLSLYGISYGTGVAATFATVFTQHVGKFLIDSNMPRNADILTMSTTSAQAQNTNFQRMAYACENYPACKKQFNGQVQVGVEAVFKHLEDGGPDNGIYIATYTNPKTDCCKKCGANGSTSKACGDTCIASSDECQIPAGCACNAAVKKPRPPAYLAQQLYDSEQVANVGGYDLCYGADEPPSTCVWGWIGVLWQKLQAGDAPGFNYVLTKIVPLDTHLQASELRRRRSQAGAVINPACPGYTCALNPGAFTSYTAKLPGHENTAQTLVMSQSAHNSCLNEDEFITAWKTVGGRFKGMNSGWPAHIFAQTYSLTYYFPNERPVAPTGAPLVTGLIMGNIYDFATPYAWTLSQAEAFPSAPLVTTTAMMHGVKYQVNTLDGKDVVKDRRRMCAEYKAEYLRNGTLPGSGTTCMTETSLFSTGGVTPGIAST